MSAEAALSSAVSEGMVQQLGALMVEGYLLPVAVDEQETLQQILAACDNDLFTFKVFQFEVNYLYGQTPICSCSSLIVMLQIVLSVSQLFARWQHLLKTIK